MPRMQHTMVVDIVQYQLDASIHLADAVFSGTEKIDRAMLDVTHQAVDGQLKFARAVADMRDPGKMADLRVAIAARPEKAMLCQQQIMAAMVEMQAEFGRSIRNYMDRMSATAASEADDASRQPAAGGAQAQAQAQVQAQNLMSHPLSGMISVWEQAFREATRLANQNMMVARSNVENAAHAAGEAMARSMEAGGVNGHAHGTQKARA
ncbi:MAG: phasin family protein, partial [Burkholderiaceae bacterium]|nr:phasin family protein [Burkholderiaceae bacterium]